MERELRPHPSPLPEGEGTLWGRTGYFCINSSPEKRISVLAGEIDVALFLTTG